MLKMLGFMLLMMPIIFSFNMWEVIFLLLLFMFMSLFVYSSGMCISEVSYFLGVDLLSWGLVLLSIWISILMLLASELIFFTKNYGSFFNFVVLALLLFYILTFFSFKFIMFLYFFEMSLIPTLFLILGWGYQPERLEAGFYLLFYTLFASLPLLVSIFYYEFYFYSLIIFENYFISFNIYLYVGMLSAFLVKMPMFMVHVWLPKAHVEAPISGSMILAGIMLKLGGYGLLRMILLLKQMNYFLNIYLIVISLMGGLWLSFLCLRQMDLKLIIAYSSVVHMSMVLGGLFTLNSLGFYGSYCLMISHGLCSSGLFCLANMVYERSSSRNIFLNKGFLNLLPVLSLWWFLLISSNMAAPPSLNLLGEIILMSSILSFNINYWLILMFLSFFSVCYSLYLYTYSQHGNFYNGLFNFNSVSMRELNILLLHWFPLNYMILKSDLCLMWF
uniref:NADH-ubiquinone oxidoreductase chain 4 n=1 Tax=Coniopteryx sp. YW-2016 TaxID=1821761 RepID=A0A1S5QYD4_9NEOP|nr:NADH dehydrogenase subunit 4 [Coniopteryx sp. YW-2016]